MADLSKLKSYSASSIKGGPVKGLNDHTLVIDLGNDEELRVPADPSILDRHDAVVLGDYWLVPGGEGAGVVVPRLVFEALFGADQSAEDVERIPPATGPVPDDALGLTTESLQGETRKLEEDPQAAMEKSNAEGEAFTQALDASEGAEDPAKAEEETKKKRR